MRQVFFITDEQLAVMLWKKQELLAEYLFRWNENDNSEIHQYLEDSRDIPASIIVDVLEEEVTLTSIPHTAGRDRKSLIERTVSRLHRDSEFTYARVVGRMENRRRDDRLLVTGITSQRLLVNWVELFTEYGLQIRGIHSLPVLSSQLLKVLKIKKGLVLLISQQGSGFIRQSVFDDGVLFYSRNIPITEHLSTERMSEDMQKTQKYLENQKILSSGTTMNAVFMADQALFDAMQGLDELLPQMDISYVTNASLQRALEIETSYRVGSREIYAALLVQKGMANHYAREQDSKKYRQIRNEHWFNVASVIVTFLLIVAAVNIYIDSRVLEKQTAELRQQLAGLQRGNNELNKVINSLPTSTRNMKLLVDNIEELKKKNESGFEKLLINISQVMQAYKKIDLLRLNWHYNAQPVTKGRVRRRAAEMDSRKQSLTLQASIDASSLSNEKASREVEKFVESLRLIDNVLNVSMTQEAIKASAKDRISKTLSANEDKVLKFSVYLELGRAG